MDYETALIAGVVGVITSAVTAYTTAHFKIREDNEKWQREFALKFAQVQAEDLELSHSLAKQFAIGFLVIKEDDSICERIFIPSNCRRVVGRGDEINIESIFVSRKHAVFSADNSNVYIDDLGSTNGTFLNGEKINRRCKLKSGDIINIGDTEISYTKL